jgi:FkbM family methyltransferase
MKFFLERASHRIRRLFAKRDTPLEILLFGIDYSIKAMTGRDLKLRYKPMIKRNERKYRTGNTYTLKAAKLPLLDPVTSMFFWGCVFEDTFEAYLEHNDCYDETEMSSYYDLMLEGTYGLRNDLVDVTVEAGDVVLDVGSWIGDFAAYASIKGAFTYAFEPSDATFDYLSQTAKLNKNIYPVKKGLGAIKSTETFSSNMNNSMSDAIISSPGIGEKKEKDYTIDITTIDAFVKENNLTHVDFIKADIEGYERYMLEGARETLKKFAPKLAICTYHLPDDPEVLEKIIREANPDYNVVQKRKKLYASVPKL